MVFHELAANLRATPDIQTYAGISTRFWINCERQLSTQPQPVSADFQFSETSRSSSNGFSTRVGAGSRRSAFGRGMDIAAIRGPRAFIFN